MKLKHELLAPAGGFPQLIAAVKSGADAVYFGLKEFSMRANAKNFEIKDFKKIKKICGKRAKKYLTLNTIIYDKELEKIKKIFEKIKGKIDAIICWDFSVINLCKKYKIPFHISTQASVSNSETAKFYKKLGAERVILARELNLKQIKKISKIIPVECFCHGAMCVAISGRCFMSQHLFGKSANRGECVQVCRRNYFLEDEEGKKLCVGKHTILSAKDLCTLPFMDKLKKTGITAFKIEGRNRDARYVETAVRSYRKAIDNKLSKKEIDEELKKLSSVYTKGFSSGFYLGVPTSDDFLDAEHSLATEKKEFVGKITNYFSKASVGAVKILGGKIRTGDRLIVIGNTTGIEHAKVERIEIHNKPVETAKKGQEVGIKLPKVRKGDEVYRIVNSR